MKGNKQTNALSDEHYDSAVTAIKHAILQQQVQAARQVNAVQLALYYSVGQYIPYILEADTGAKAQ